MSLSLGIGFARADEGVGGALYGLWFDGVNDEVSVAHNANFGLSTDFAISCDFVYRGSDGSFVSKWKSDNQSGWSLAAAAGKLRVGFRKNGGNYWGKDAGFTFVDGTEYNIIVNYPGGGSVPTVYIDGSLQTLSAYLASGDALTDITDSGEAMTVGSGRMFSTGKAYTASVVRHVRIHDTILDATARTAVLANTNSGNEVGQWIGDGKENANWLDTSGNGNNGTVAGSPARAISTDNGATWAQG